jgi:NitT/TauT family transport system ATP-binding protein
MTDPQTHPLALNCQSISHWFGSKKVLYDVNLRIERGQFVSLVGPSGCGKSTLLRAIVGTHLPRKGNILVHSKEPGSKPSPVTGPGRDRGIVYQHYSLFPFLTALENVAIGLKLDETNIPFRTFRWFAWRRLRKQHLKLAAEYLDRVKLGDAMHLYPHEMSGGMRQRVAIAQALVMKPEIILLDEPFGALDEATREELQRALLLLYAENQTALKLGEAPPFTLIIVTHELNEAIYVGDRLIGLSQYWDWEGENHTQPPGASIVYDVPSPVFDPDAIRDFEIFEKQRDSVRNDVFNPNCKKPRIPVES